MPSMDVLLKRGAVITSILIVVVLSAVAIFSALDNASPDQPEAADQAPAPTGRAFPGERVTINDGSSPLTVGCLPENGGEPGPTEVYMVVVENLGTSESSYLVAATLTDESGATQRLVVEFPVVPGGQDDEEFLVPDASLGPLADCVVTAVETNRRIVLLP